MSWKPLGVKVDHQPETAAQALREHHFAFFFAPNYHPAFKNIAPVRKLCGEKGQRTIFNFLGPLLNPARPTAQLIPASATGIVRTDGARVTNSWHTTRNGCFRRNSRW